MERPDPMTLNKNYFKPKDELKGSDYMLTKYEKNLAMKAIRRKKLYLALSMTSVIVGLGLAAFYTWEAYTQAGFDIGIHFVVVVLILLNARQNLRQYGYAKILEVMMLKLQG